MTDCNFTCTNDSDGNASSPNGPFRGSAQTFKNPFETLHIKVIFIVLYSLVFACCFFETSTAATPGNLVVLFVVVTNARMRTRTTFFLANLAIADFAVGVFCVLPNLSTFLSPTWYLGRVMCKVYYFVQQMSFTTPIVLLTVISVERYIAILYPLKAKRFFTYRRLKIAQALIWILSAAYNSSQLVVFETYSFSSPNGEEALCYPRIELMDMKAYTLANFILWYVIPLLLMSVMYFKIAATLWYSSGERNFALQNSQQPNSAPSQHGGGLGKKPSSCVRTGTSSHPSLVSFKKVDRFSPHGNVVIELNELGRKPAAARSESISMEGETETEFVSEFDGHTTEVDDSDSDSNSNSDVEGQGGRDAGGRASARQQPKAGGFGGAAYVVSKSSATTGGQLGDPKVSSSVPRSRVSTQKVMQSRKKVIRLLVAVIGSFAICVLPFHIRTLSQFWSSNSSPDSLLPPISYLIFYVNSGLNPFLYAILSDNFRRSLRESCRHC